MILVHLICVDACPDGSRSDALRPSCPDGSRSDALRPSCPDGSHSDALRPFQCARLCVVLHAKLFSISFTLATWEEGDKSPSH